MTTPADPTDNAAVQTLPDAVARIDALLPPDAVGADEGALEAIVADFGHYDGLPPQIELEDDGRTMKLLTAIAFHRPDKTAWPVPQGIECDGASIPRAFWTIIGGPFEGRYRNASIVHDHYCVIKARPWRDTHRMFWEAMRCSGVGVAQAGIMYYAVRQFGPRWSDDPLEGIVVEAPAPAPAQVVADAETIIRSKLDADAIDALLETRDAMPSGSKE